MHNVRRQIHGKTWAQPLEQEVLAEVNVCRNASMLGGVRHDIWGRMLHFHTQARPSQSIAKGANVGMLPLGRFGSAFE